jgi:hypothetical protein
VFALGGEGRHELERVAASDYSRAQISIKLASMSSDLVLELIERADRIAKEAFAGTGIAVLTTGSGRLFSTLDHYLVMSQISSFSTAFFTVFGVIFIVFRSFRFGVLTIAPNLLPVVAVLGVMGYLDISLNVATIMVASVALGIVDDDTIHFINRYRREAAAGATTDEAIEIATTHEGRASLTTAIINSAGYAVLLLSEYKPTAWFGGLLALTMATAFLAEVFILPATIKLFPRIFGADAIARSAKRAIVAGLLLLVTAHGAAAQTPTGYVSLFGDYFPNRQNTTELRGRLFVEEHLEPSSRIAIELSGFAEGLLARRPTADGAARRVTDGIVRVHDANLTFSGKRIDLLAGYARITWGKLDEVQPTDVVNPLDVSRFFFEGRSEARLPVLLVRGRLHVDDTVTIEGVYVPTFRSGRFDRLAEPSSPFNLPLALAGPMFDVDDRPPPFTARSAQGGARVSATSGTVDWSVSVYRGFESFGLYEIDPRRVPAIVARVHPRFTMIGGDVEAVRAQWGLRGEVAAFVEDSFQGSNIRVVSGSSVDAGAGVDRKAAGVTWSGTVLFHAESHDRPLTLADASTGRKDVSLVGSFDRTFSRERYRLRGFAVVNATEGSGFLRGIAMASVRDNLALEGSIGWFAGDGRDLVGRFGDSDFAYARLKYYF